MTKNFVLTPPDYARDIRHYEFDLSSSGFQYSVGDCMGVFAQNNREDVNQFLDEYGLSQDAIIQLADTQVWGLICTVQSCVGYIIFQWCTSANVMLCRIIISCLIAFRVARIMWSSVEDFQLKVVLKWRDIYIENIRVVLLIGGPELAGNLESG